MDEDQRADEDGRQDAAKVVDRVDRLVDVGRHVSPGHEQRDRGERQRHEEDRAPLESLEQEPGHERAQRGDGAAEGGPERDRVRPPGPRSPERRDQGERGRVGHARGHATSDASRNQHLDRRRERSDEAGRDRQTDTEQQQHLSAVSVSNGPEPQDGGGEPERVADGHEVQLRLGCVEREADRRECDVGDRQVQVRDRGHDDQRREDDLPVRGVAHVARGDRGHSARHRFRLDPVVGHVTHPPTLVTTNANVNRLCSVDRTSLTSRPPRCRRPSAQWRAIAADIRRSTST